MLQTQSSGASHFERLSQLVSTRRVVPIVPAGRSPFLTSVHEATPAACERDDTASWSAWICYQDAKGGASERRITCHKLSGHYGRASIVHAYCHERGAPRDFRVDRITELACVETGEVFEPEPHFALLASTGALMIEDKALTKLAVLLSFLARCDGDYHPLEVASLREQVERYARFFGGDDRTVETALRQIGRLAPDGDDVVTALRAFTRMPDGPSICRFALDAGAAIIDADNRHAPEEIAWALEISDVLKNIAERR